MTQSSALSSEQFALVSEIFAELLRADLSGDAARAFLMQQTAGREAVRDVLLDMLVAHEAELAAHDDEQGLHASALRAVRSETRAAGDFIDSRIPERIGPYRITRFIASGGMGTVYEAEQENPSRRVAIKVIRLELLAPESIRRFEAEGHLLARLRHPGIARVYSMGRMKTPTGPLPYLVLEYIAGLPIHEYVREHDLDVRSRMTLLRTVADAVQYAHDNGVLHRDLKPSNVLVDSERRPHVLDFGIGRTFDDEHGHASLTASGLFMGTLAYMSPEQAVRTGEPLDVRVDVYGLGAVGYELLAERPPHIVQGLPLHQAVQQVVERDAPSLSTLVPTIDEDLSAIFSKALATDATRRYRSVREFGDDLRRYLSHEPVEARAPSRFYQMRKLVRRNRATFGLLALVGVALLSGLAVALWQRSTAIKAETRAQQVAKRATLDHRAALMRAAWFGVEAERWSEVVGTLDQLKLNDNDQTLEARLLRAHAHNAASIRTISNLPAHARVIVSPHPDRAACRDANGTICYVDLNAARLEPLFDEEHSSPEGRLSWSHGKDPSLIVSSKDQLIVIDCEQRRIARTVTSTSPSQSLASEFRECEYVLWREASPPRIVDIRAGVMIDDARLSTYLAGHRLDLSGGRFLSAYDPRGTRRCYDLKTSTAIETPRLPGDLTLRGFSPDGRLTLNGLRRPMVQDTASGETWMLSHRIGLSMADFDFARHESLIAILLLDGSVQIWDLARRALRRTLWDARLKNPMSGTSSVGVKTAQAVRFRPDGSMRTLTHGAVIDWPPMPSTGELDHAIGHQPYPYIYRLAWHPGGRWLASAAWDGRVVIWDTWTEQEVGHLSFDDPAVANVRRENRGYFAAHLLDWSPDGERLAVQLAKPGVIVWDVWSKRVVFSSPVSRAVLGLEREGLLVDNDGRIDTVSFAEASRPVPPKTNTDPMRLYRNPRAASLPPRWGEHMRRATRVIQASGAPTGVHARFTVQNAAGDDDPWHHPTNSQVLSAILTHDGSRALLGLRDGTIHLYDVDDRRQLMVMHGHNDYVSALAISPDGTMLASGAGDGSVKLWPTTTIAKRLHRQRLAALQATRIAPIVDRTWLAASDLEGRLRACLADPTLEPRDRVAASAMVMHRSR